VVLHHVTQRTDGVVEAAALLDTEVLRHGDVDLGDAVPVPQFGERGVGEPQALQVGDRLLAQEMVDPQDLVLAQHRAHPGVEVAGRGQVMAERFLHRDPGSLQ